MPNRSIPFFPDNFFVHFTISQRFLYTSFLTFLFFCIITMKPNLFELQRRLLQYIQKPLEVSLNRNSSTFIRVQFRKPIIASVHEAFLDAPEAIIRSLASFISGNKIEEEKLYAFMVEYFKKTPSKKTSPKGKTYDLAALFQQLNNEYFSERLSLTTTWWKKKKLSRTSCTLGVFVDALQLIKIDALLDTPQVPQYVVESVLHHEMLHALIPPKKDRAGRFLAHTPEFRTRERSFPHFHETEAWLRNNPSLFF